jgi:signal transduction histidine kinase
MRIWSLRIRLIVMFMLIVMIALGAFAIFASRVTRDKFQNYLNNGQANDQKLITQIQTLYQQPQNTQQLQTLIEQNANQTNVRTLVINSQQVIIADSARKLIGQTLTISLFFTLENQKVGVMPPPQALFPSHSPTRIIATDGNIIAAGPPPENGNFIDSVNRALWLAVLVAGGVAFALAIMLSGTILKPVRALTRAARQLEIGNLSQRVQIKKRDEIGDLAHAFDTMAASLERAEQQRRQLLSNIAHELRTPLTNIRGYLEAIQDQVIAPDITVIASIYEEAMLLSRLVTDLQDLSLAEAGHLRLERVSIALEDVITRAINALALQANNKQLLLATDIASDLPLVEADAQRIGQILRNLLNNAIKYTPEQGKIQVRAWAQANTVQMQVEDSGPGISAEHLPHIFKHFYRADTSRTRETGGSGLGLAIVEQLVHAHGGTISVESYVGQGTRFNVTLPAAPQ